MQTGKKLKLTMEKIEDVNNEQIVPLERNAPLVESIENGNVSQALVPHYSLAVDIDDELHEDGDFFDEKLLDEVGKLKNSVSHSLTRFKLFKKHSSEKLIEKCLIKNKNTIENHNLKRPSMIVCCTREKKFKIDSELCGSVMPTVKDYNTIEKFVEEDQINEIRQGTAVSLLKGDILHTASKSARMKIRKVLEVKSTCINDFLTVQCRCIFPFRVSHQNEINFISFILNKFNERKLCVWNNSKNYDEFASPRDLLVRNRDVICNYEHLEFKTDSVANKIYFEYIGRMSKSGILSVIESNVNKFIEALAQMNLSPSVHKDTLCICENMESEIRVSTIPRTNNEESEIFKRGKNKYILQLQSDDEQNCISMKRMKRLQGYPFRSKHSNLEQHKSKDVLLGYPKDEFYDIEPQRVSYEKIFTEENISLYEGKYSDETAHETKEIYSKILKCPAVIDTESQSFQRTKHLEINEQQLMTKNCQFIETKDVPNSRPGTQILGREAPATTKISNTFHEERIDGSTIRNLDTEVAIGREKNFGEISNGVSAMQNGESMITIPRMEDGSCTINLIVIEKKDANIVIFRDQRKGWMDGTDPHIVCSPMGENHCLYNHCRQIRVSVSNLGVSCQSSSLSCTRKQDEHLILAPHKDEIAKEFIHQDGPLAQETRFEESKTKPILTPTLSNKKRKIPGLRIGLSKKFRKY